MTTNPNTKTLELQKEGWSLMADALLKPGWATTHADMVRAVELAERIEAAGFSGPIDMDAKGIACAKKAVAFWLSRGGLPIARTTIELLEALSIDQ